MLFHLDNQNLDNFIIEIRPTVLHGTMFRVWKRGINGDDMIVADLRLSSDDLLILGAQLLYLAGD